MPDFPRFANAHIYRLGHEHRIVELEPALILTQGVTDQRITGQVERGRGCQGCLKITNGLFSLVLEMMDSQEEDSTGRSEFIQDDIDSLECSCFRDKK